MPKLIKGLAVALPLAVGIWILAAGDAMAKKSGTEIRNEAPPSGRGSGVDDRQARSDTRGSGEGRDRGGSSGRSDAKNGSGSKHQEGDEGSSTGPAASRVRISEEDRL